MNMKIVIAAAAAFAIASTGAADAAKRKRQKVRHYAPVVSMPAVPYGARTPGPPWAQPWECYTDEGYGRYMPCGAGKDK